MTKLKMLTAATVAACGIGAVGLVGTPTASAAPKYSCTVATALATAYTVSGDVNSAAGLDIIANYYYGKAEGLIEAAC